MLCLCSRACVCVCVWRGSHGNLHCVGGGTPRMPEASASLVFPSGWDFRRSSELQNLLLYHFFLPVPPLWTHLLLDAWTTLW